MQHMYTHIFGIYVTESVTVYEKPFDFNKTTNGKKKMTSNENKYTEK